VAAQLAGLTKGSVPCVGDPNLVDKNVFQILEFHHATEMNNKWKPQYYCLLCMIYNTRTLM
jgi:hypothetical protein